MKNFIILFISFSINLIIINFQFLLKITIQFMSFKLYSHYNYLINNSILLIYYHFPIYIINLLIFYFNFQILILIIYFPLIKKIINQKMEKTYCSHFSSFFHSKFHLINSYSKYFFTIIINFLFLYHFHFNYNFNFKFN